MPAVYTTIGGELIDEIAWQHYGHQNGTTEAVLDANHGLAARPRPLAAGIEITLPDLALPAVSTRPVKLYD